MPHTERRRLQLQVSRPIALVEREHGSGSLGIRLAFTSVMRTYLSRSVPGIVGVAALVAAIGALPRSSAHACSVTPNDPTFDGAPASGETDVPTNVVPVFWYFPIYEETADGVPGKFTIETSAGEPVTATARKAGQQWFEIVPAKPLQPNTAYRIRGSWKRLNDGPTFQTQLEFTTGAGPRTGAVKVPVAKLQNLDWKPSRIDSCAPQTQSTCVALQDAGLFEVTYVDSFNQLKEEWTTLTKTSYFATALTPALAGGTNFRCVRLRTRAVDGAFSDPIMHCGTDAPVFHVPDDRVVTCSNQGLVVPPGAPVKIDPPGTTPLPSGTSGIGGVAGAGASSAGTGTWFLAGTGAYAAGARAVAGAAAPAIAGAGAATGTGTAIGGGPAGKHATGAAGDDTEDSDATRAGVQTFPSKSARRVQSCSMQPGLKTSMAGLSVPLAMVLGALRIRTRHRASRIG
jgi:hypothetical protein